jgi:hypothetical protein
MTRLPPQITDALDETGLSWTVKTGSKHFKIVLAGRLAGVYPKGKTSENAYRAVLNTITQIKHTARKVKEES